ncbi:uncharacterized protein G2W53_039445 [Senna tora]|uniref:Uncharacterized protein n=1 Tax=Senna tora TaxID=362788 RepID=A0A834T1C4_9FABA|nr:uncharacterized protein G2W53_039445 [Senna tora]
MAIYKGSEVARDLGIQRLQVESDAKTERVLHKNFCGTLVVD